MEAKGLVEPYAMAGLTGAQGAQERRDSSAMRSRSTVPFDAAAELLLGAAGLL